MKPGATTRPVASSASPLGGASGPFPGAMRVTRPLSIHMLRFASVPLEGSMIRPFLMSSMGRSPGIVGFRPSRNHVKEEGHPHGKAIRNLFQNARLGTIGYGWINFQPANHRTGVKNKRIRTGELETFGRELISKMYSSRGRDGSCSRSC